MKLNPLNQRVIEVMKHYDLGQTQLANITGVTRQTANGIALGKTRPGATFLIGLLKKYKNIDARWLLMGEGQMSNMSNKSDKIQNVNDNDFVENKNFISKELYNNLRKDYDNMRDDIEKYKNQIAFLQSLFGDEVKRKKTG